MMADNLPYASVPLPDLQRASTGR